MPFRWWVVSSDCECFQSKITSEMAEKLEVEMELKEAMASNWAMEQELGSSRQQLSELQEEHAKASCPSCLLP